MLMQMFKMLLLLYLFVLIHLFKTASPALDSLSFSYSSFDSNSKNLTFGGDATAVRDSGIQLTTNQKDRSPMWTAGNVTYSKLLHLWDRASGNLADFSTNFTFNINSNNNASHADGMAFFLAPEDYPFPDDKKDGGGLGLISGNSTNSSFLAVEFDTYDDSEYFTDPQVNHVGIDINSMVSVNYTTWENSNILNGKPNSAWIVYDSSTKIFSVNFTSVQDDTTVFLDLSYAVDLRTVLPEWVLVGFTAASGFWFETHTLTSWSFSSSMEIPDDYPPSVAPSPVFFPQSLAPAAAEHKPGGRNRFGLAIGLSFALVFVVVIGGVGYAWLKKRNTVFKEDESSASDLSGEFEQSAGPKKFSYVALAQATNNFAEEEKLGEGGFGGVYKGFLSEFNSNVAIKKISSSSGQGRKEYASEVRIISRLRHKNLVQLVGWCHEKGDFLLVYELMANGSLDHHLFLLENTLSWATRYKIACGVASALLYLHEEWQQAVLHRDIKTSNIMLDSDFNAKLGDFGLARLVDHGKRSATTILAGTLGYLAPECLYTSKASTESDVFSFGIVCLEIACGRKPIDDRAEEGQVTLVKWVWQLYGEGEIIKAMDPRLTGLDYDRRQVECLMILGLWCAHPDYQLRPSVRQAVAVLSFEAPLPKLPSMLPLPSYRSFPTASDISTTDAFSATASSISSALLYSSSAAST